MTEAEKRKHRVCFTGHRTYKLHRSEQEIKFELEIAIKRAIAEEYTTFITGMAYGVDLWAGQIVVRLRETNPNLHLVAAIPFYGFESRWTRNQKREFNDLLEQVDIVKYISRNYHAYAYQQRNEWMVDHSSLVIGVCNGEVSGTRNTLDYAERVGVSTWVLQG